MRTITIFPAPRTAEELFDSVGTSLCWPAWFGRNWDAFWDLLNDADMTPAGTRLVIGVTALETVSPLSAHRLRAVADALAREGSGTTLDLIATDPGPSPAADDLI